MYQPKKYKKKDPQYIYDFIKAHPFATFILNGSRILATHIPVLIEGNVNEFRLYSHIANHNEQFSYLNDGAEALLIFQGAHGYISSSWYREKDISTWDYSAVHINVKLKIQSEAELETALENLVETFEKDQQQPLYYKDIPQKMLEDHLPLITGFWCKPFKIEAIAKLNQGYEIKDISEVVKNLENQQCPMASELSEDIKRENEP